MADYTNLYVNNDTGEVLPSSARTLVCLQYSVAQNVRNTSEAIHGGATKTNTAAALNSSTPITGTTGLGKILVVPKAGSDATGSITITGTSIDRDSGARVNGDTEVISLDGLASDSSTTDVNSLPVYAITDAYLSAKWWLDGYTISTTDVTLTSCDVYAVAFDQFNDSGAITIDTVDMTFLITNAAGHMSMVLTKISILAGRAAMTGISTAVLAAADTAADRFYRIRRSSIASTMNGSTDGVFLSIFWGPTPQTYFQNVATKIWAYVHAGGYQ